MTEQVTVTVTLTAPDWADSVNLADALFADLCAALADSKHGFLRLYEVSRVTVTYVDPSTTHVRTEEAYTISEEAL